MTAAAKSDGNLAQPERHTVLISEASKMYCDLLTKAFQAVCDKFEVVASASSAPEILQLINEHRPKVVVLSDSLEEGPNTGLKLITEIRKTNTEVRILLATASPDRDLVIEAFRFGADGVFCRTSSFDLLCKSVDALARGQIWANTTELRYVLDEFVRAPKQRKVDPAVEKRMTKRESDVVRLAVEGLSNREIARELGLTEHTVKNYLFRIFDKLGVSNRVELVLSCLRQEEVAREEIAVVQD